MRTRLIGAVAGCMAALACHPAMAEPLPTRCEARSTIMMFMESVNSSSAARASGTEVVDVRNMKTVRAEESRTLCKATIVTNDGEEGDVTITFRNNSLGQVIWEVQEE